MGFFRFRRSIKLAPGVRLNLSKSGVSTSLGVRGAHVTLGHGRVRQTVGIPGTGLSYTQSQRIGESGEALDGPARSVSRNRGDGRDVPGGGLFVIASIAAVILFALGMPGAYAAAAGVAVFLVVAVLYAWARGTQGSAEVPPVASEELLAAKATFDANRGWLHERWLRADQAHAAGAHGGEFPGWYFDPVTEPQLERLHGMHVKVEGGELTKGAASDLIGIFQPMDDGDAEACRFFNVEIPQDQRNETRGRMEVARIFADPLNRTKWEERQPALS